MARYVDLDKVTVWHCPRNIAQMREWAFGLPVEDVKPVVHAHWERKLVPSLGYPIPLCSHCGESRRETSDFCPDCGAKMDEEVE